MAKSKTPLKRAKQAEASRVRNATHKSKLKTAVKQYRDHITAEEPAEAGKALGKVISLIDKNVSKGLLHKNTAARKKSALTKKYNALAQKAE
jgi:small subunit ribosomal protein S20